jgi:hypothetical protein
MVSTKKSRESLVNRIYITYGWEHQDPTVGFTETKGVLVSTTNSVALPNKKRMKGRRLVLVDIENVVGGAVLHPRAAAWAKTNVREVVEIRPHDHVVIGTSHIGLLAAGTGWEHVRYVVGSGSDGADLALLEVFDESVAERFGDVVLVSGDGIFADAVADLAAASVSVTVVAHTDRLSRRLRLAATEVVHLTRRYESQPVALGGAA